MLCFSLILDEWTLLGHCGSLLLVAVIFNLCSVENFQKLCSLGSHSETSQFIETLLRETVLGALTQILHYQHAAVCSAAGCSH